MELKAAARTWPIICLVILTTSSPVALAINCYVCGPASRDAFPASTESSANSNHLRPCEEFDASSNKTDFEKECPENFHGCITQIEGNVVSRSCESLKIQSCGVLTDAAYCLCGFDLCNSGQITRPTVAPSELQKQEQYGDDEDYVQREGSGNGPDYIDSSLEKELSGTTAVITNVTSITESSVKMEVGEGITTNRIVPLDSPRTVSGSNSLFNINLCVTVCIPLLVSLKRIGK